VIGLFGISQVDDAMQLDLPAVYPDTLAPIRVYVAFMLRMAPGSLSVSRV
jgi:hypothetical protein